MWCVLPRGYSSPFRRWVGSYKKKLLTKHIIRWYIFHSYAMSRTCIVISDVDFSSRCAIGSNMMFLVSGLYSQKHGSVPSYGIFALGPHWSATCSDLHHWPDSEIESSGPGSLFTPPPHGNGRHIYLAAPTRATQMLSFFCWFKRPNTIFLKYMKEHCICLSFFLPTQLYWVPKGTKPRSYWAP